MANGATFDAGTYDLSETGPAGYTASAWVCVGGTQDGSDTVTVGLGESATCTITNDDHAPSLTLVKVVVNDNGGTAVATDWTLTATGPTGFTGLRHQPARRAAPPSTPAPTTCPRPARPAITPSAWICVGGTAGRADTITLGLGRVGHLHHHQRRQRAAA